uniref:Uncharacterized protein n=1 Tax=Arundo donax TaxID=35708 RepID=A0A0A9C3T9_ARUDO
MRSISSAANSSLETIIIDDGCVGLEEISFRGCAKLKNLLLRGLFKNLYSLDMSGTAVKMLDLSVVTALEPEQLILLECDKVCAIRWPPKNKRKEYFNKLHIDTTTQSVSSLSVMHGGRAPSEFNWYISVRMQGSSGQLYPSKAISIRSMYM